MKKDEAALLLRVIYMSDYLLDDREEEMLDDIKLKLMNVHPDQIESRETGDELTCIISRALITFTLLLLSSSLLLYFFA